MHYADIIDESTYVAEHLQQYAFLQNVRFSVKTNV